MSTYEIIKDDFLISTDKSKLDLQCIHQYLSCESYWAKNIPLALVEKSINGSCCFGIYHRRHGSNDFDEQIGFARVITDHATFGYLADVFVLSPFRKQGLSKWLMESIMQHPELQGFRRWMLATKDAHGLYAQFGFKALEKPERFMRYSLFDEYPPASGK